MGYLLISGARSQLIRSHITRFDQPSVMCELNANSIFKLFAMLFKCLTCAPLSYVPGNGAVVFN